MATKAFNPSLNPADWPADKRERYAYLEQVVRRYDCLFCKSQPRIAHMALLTGELNYGLRCNCWTAETKQLPTLANVIHHVDERRWNMVRQEIARRPNDLPAITKQDVKDHLASRATDGELELFVRFCISEELNPFAREAYLVKPGDQPAYIQVDYKVFLKRAHRDPDYRYYESGVVVLDANGELADRVGAMRGPADTLYGGWVKVYMAHRDKPIEARVMLKNFEKRKRDGSLTSFWTTMPEFMIEKVAINTGFRRAIRGIEDLLGAGGAMRVEMAEVEVPIVDALEAPAETPEASGPDPTTGGLFEAPTEPVSGDVGSEEPTDTPLFPPEQASESPEAKPGPRHFADAGAFRKALRDDFGLATAAEANKALDEAGLGPLAELRNLDEAYANLAAHRGQPDTDTEEA